MIQKANRYLIVPLAIALILCAACATRQPVEQPADAAAGPAGIGTVQCATTADKIELLTDKGVARSGDGGEIQLTAGTYSVLAYSLRAKDAGGAEWRIVGQAGSSGNRLDLKANETVQLRFGAPLKATVATRKVSSNEYSFSPKITGQAGEYYSPRDITRNGSTPPAPTFEIRDGSGAKIKTIASGRFRYG
jgi:hypothetical protein